MHLVVVGGNGFIGRRFARHALAAGHRLTVVSRGPGKPPLPGAAFVTGGIAALAENAQLLEAADAVCHLASTTIPASSFAEPARAIAENLLPTITLLEAMRRHGNRRILFLSSGGAVYGVPRSVPISEDHQTDPISPYGLGKLAIEKYLKYYASVHGFSPLIIRPANPYGPDQGKIGQLGAVWTFLQMIREGRTAVLFGDGSAVRDFVHVDDLSALMLVALERESEGIYNCGSGQGVSLGELIAALERATGDTLRIELQPARAFDPPAIVLDIAKARRELGWEPQFSLKAGIAGLLRE